MSQNRLPVVPTVSVLAVMKTRLQGAVRGHSLLKKKADALTVRCAIAVPRPLCSVFSTQGEQSFMFPVLGMKVTSRFAEYGQKPTPYRPSVPLEPQRAAGSPDTWCCTSCGCMACVVRACKSGGLGGPAWAEAELQTPHACFISLHALVGSASNLSSAQAAVRAAWICT